jgi:hypothetical protein
MSRCHKYLRLLTVPIALAGTLAIMACGPERPADSVQGSPPAALAGESAESAASAGTAREPVVQLNPARQQPAEPTGGYPFDNFNLPDEGESALPIVRYPLRIENGTVQIIVVAATAGASPVVLGTLDAGDHVRIDLEAPAGRLELTWESTDGSASGIRPIRVLADSVQVVRLEAGSGPR